MPIFIYRVFSVCDGTGPSDVTVKEVYSTEVKIYH